METPSPNRFSWGALVYGPFYYGAMQDWTFAVLSIIFSLLVYTLPAVIPLAFFARRRAWQRKTWESEEQFERVQHQWDRSAIIGAVFAIIGLYFVSRYIFSMLASAFGTTDPTVILQQIQSLQG